MIILFWSSGFVLKSNAVFMEHNVWKIIKILLLVVLLRLVWTLDRISKCNSVKGKGEGEVEKG